LTSTTSSNRQWIVPPPSTNAEIRLFCFPPAGAGAGIYRRWTTELSPEIDVFRILPPGRESRLRESRCTDIEAYLDGLVPELLPLLNKPFAFFGHSMGSLIAYSLAQRLNRAYSILPRHLFVSSFHPPHAIPNENIGDLPQEDFIRELRSRYDGIPDQLLEEPELLELLLLIIRADLAIVENYRYDPQHPISCPISAFGGYSDNWVSEPQLLEWRDHTSAEFDISMYPGNHYFLDTVLADLCSKIRQSLISERKPQFAACRPNRPGSSQ